MNSTVTTRFGLPTDVRFCTRCVISNQRASSVVEYANAPESTKPTIHFDADGVCDACRIAESKSATDWAERDRELRELCARYRKTEGYDCIVPGSGGKDSFYAAWRLKYEYGMHPLTVTWAPHLYTDWGRRNFDRWIHAGFDNQLHTPSGLTHRVLTRLALENLFHPFQPFVIGQKSLAAKVAATLNIGLVFYGENEAEYGNPKEDALSAQRDAAYYSGHPDDVYLGGVALSEMPRYGLSRRDLAPYLPIPEADVQVHYLGYYLRWHPQTAYYHAVEHGGFECSPHRTPGTYSKYNSIDDKIDDFHYYTTYIKFGIGRATYDAAQEIRSGEIDRSEGVALVKRFDGEFPDRFCQQFLDYVSPPGFARMTLRTFKDLCDTFRPEHLWREEGGERMLKHTVWEEQC